MLSEVPSLFVTVRTTGRAGRAQMLVAMNSRAMVWRIFFVFMEKRLKCFAKIKSLIYIYKFCYRGQSFVT